MLNNISLGTYYPGKSVLHRVQARTKLIAVLAIALALLIANQHIWHFAPFVVALSLMIAGILFAGVSFGEIWRRTWLLMVLTAIGVVTTINTLNGTDDRIIYALGPINTSYGLVQDTLLMSILFLCTLVFTGVLPVATLRRVWRLTWMRRIKFFIVLLTLAALFFFWLIQSTPANTVFVLGPLPFTQSGVWSLMSFFVEFLALFVFSLLLTMTTSPVALIEGLTMLLAPLRRLRLPVDDFALMTLIALRFIPTLLEETDQLIKAQTARGADMMSGTLRERLQSLMMLFVPLMQGSLRRATELATALEARGYEMEGRQTRLYETSFALVDYVVLVVVVGVMVGALFL